MNGHVCPLSLNGARCLTKVAEIEVEGHDIGGRGDRGERVTMYKYSHAAAGQGSMGRDEGKER